MSKADDLKLLSVVQLRIMAALRGIPNAARMRKDELIGSLSPRSGGETTRRVRKPASEKNEKEKERAKENDKKAVKPANRKNGKPARGPAAAESSVPERRTRKPGGRRSAQSSLAMAGSSALAFAPRAAPQAPRPPEAGPTGDPGLPIPSSYGRDRLVLLVQDPHHLFAYWEISDATLARTARIAGEAGSPVLVLLGPAGEEQRDIDLRGGNYYLAVSPRTTYRARLALRDRRGGLHDLVAAEPVTTPADRIALDNQANGNADPLRARLPGLFQPGQLGALGSSGLSSRAFSSTALR